MAGKTMDTAAKAQRQAHAAIGVIQFEFLV
jgi:hypothetical protein